MRTICFTAGLIAAANAINLDSDVSQPDLQDFMSYLAQYGKAYSNSAEFQERRQAFSKVAKFIKQANQDPNDTANYAHNQFSDWFAGELANMFMSKESMKPAPGASSDSEAESDDEAPASDSDAEDESSAAQVDRNNRRKNRKNRKNKNKGNDTPSGPVAPVDPSGGDGPAPSDSTAGIDWRTLGAVNAVKNQGSCGSCWAFGSNAQMEGAYFAKYGTLLNLSEQQLVDCSTSNSGCNGGFMTTVFNGYSNINAMMAESDYPYKAKDGNCKANSAKATPAMTKANGTVHSSWAASDIKTALADGVMSIAVAAGNNYFQAYSSGILNTDKCPTSIDHAVAMVGWGTDATSGQEYWIVRNSWSAGWGESGYIRMAITDSGNGVCMAQSTVVTVSMA